MNSQLKTDFIVILLLIVGFTILTVDSVLKYQEAQKAQIIQAK